MQPAISYQSSDWAYKQSRALIPKAWYESDWLTTALYYLLAIPLFGLFWWQYRLSPPPVWSAIGVVSYFLGWTADVLSTWRCFGLMLEFDRRGVPFPLTERNPFIGDEPRLIKQIVTVSNLYSLAIGFAAWLVPAIGIVGGLAHLGAALNNWRKRQRLLVQLELLNN